MQLVLAAVRALVDACSDPDTKHDHDAPAIERPIDGAHPARWLRTRLGLSASEERRNAVLRAAFLAADDDLPITADHLTQAAQLEYEAMGKLATGN